jgi:hypothetical protein
VLARARRLSPHGLRRSRAERRVRPAVRLIAAGLPNRPSGVLRSVGLWQPGSWAFARLPG